MVRSSKLDELMLGGGKRISVAERRLNAEKGVAVSEVSGSLCLHMERCASDCLVGVLIKIKQLQNLRMGSSIGE